MKSLVGKIVRFLKIQSGPTAVEYAVILALIFLVCLTAIALFGRQTNSSFGRSGNEIRSAFERGR